MKTALILIAFVAAAFALDRLLLKAEERGWIYWRRRKGSPGTAAGAALEIHQILEPSKKYVLEVQRDQAPELDEEGDPPTAGHAAKGPGGKP